MYKHDMPAMDIAPRSYNSNSYTMNPVFATNKHSTGPITTGGSVVAIRYEDGVVLGADKLISYGHLRRFRDQTRIFKINETTVLAANGEQADLRYLVDLLNAEQKQAELRGDGFEKGPRAIHSWLGRVLYHRRTKGEPLFNDIVVAGWDRKESRPYLGHVSMLGVAYEAPVVCSGIATYIGLPYLREAYQVMPTMNRDQAVDSIKNCLTQLCMRECRSSNLVQLAVVNNKTVDIKDNIVLELNWDLAKNKLIKN